MYWSCLPMGFPQRSISIVQARSASSSADTCRPWYANSACSRPTVTADEEPRPEPAGRDVGQRGDLDPVRHAGHQHGLPDELVLEVLDARDDLLLGVVDVDVVVEALLDDDVDVLVDRAVEDPAAVLAVVAGQVGPAAEQADAQRCLGDDHRAARAGHSSLARRYASAVPMSRKYPSTSTARARPTSRGSRSIADVARRHAVDLVEHARMEGVHAGIRQVGNRVGAASPRTR